MRFPTLNIHCWGGLGSQLYALAYALEIQERFPERRIRILSHSGGVTKRNLELDFIALYGFEVGFLNDFRVEHLTSLSSVRTLKEYLKVFLRYPTKRLLSSLRIYVFKESEPETIAPWTLHIRGHYSSRRIKNETFSRIFNIAVKAGVLRDTNIDAAIHVRLGYLLEIQQKRPLDALRVARVFREGIKIVPHENWHLVSDSPDKIIHYLNMVDILTVNQIFRGDAWASLNVLINAKHFIASNSKLSIWAIYLGNFSNCHTDIWLPYELQNHVNFNTFPSISQLKWY